jgi:hypothetical protein
VYVAPKTAGVFALGGHSIGLGEAGIGAGAPTAALLVATAAAAHQLRRGPTRPELPLIWWAAPWWFAKQIPCHLLPSRWQPLITVWAVCLVVASIVNGVHDGHRSAAALTVCATTDLCISAVRSHRQRRPLAPRQLQPAPSVTAAAAAGTRPATAAAA